MFKKKNSNSDLKKYLKAKRTVQETLPYIGISEKGGIAQVDVNRYSKTYLISDVNYQIAQNDEQEAMFIAFGELLNYFDSSMRFQITINNKPVSVDEITNKVLMPIRGDSLDKYREDYNSILLRKISEGKNNIQQEKYLTVSIEAESIDKAIAKFNRIDGEIHTLIQKIGKSSATPLSATERLEIIYKFLNPNDEDGFIKNKRDYFNQNAELDFENLRKQGMSTKDLIAPASLDFKRDYFLMGDKYCQVMAITEVGTVLSDNFVAQMTANGYQMMTSLNYEIVDKDKAIKLIRAQQSNIHALIMDKEKRAAKNGHSAYINSETRIAEQEAENLMEDIVSKGQNMFLLTYVICHQADSLEELKENSTSLIKLAKVNGCTLKVCNFMQEIGLCSVLPFAVNKLKIKRTLTTESTCVFMPYNAIEMMQPGGNYYGLNSISHNLILLDRSTLQNQNGFILGTPGAGKSVMAKVEMIYNILNKPNSRVIVIDPESEFKVLADALGGKVIKITPSGNNHINLFDLDAKYSDVDNPLQFKTDMIISVVSTCFGQNHEMSPTQKAIVERCVRFTYKDYLNTYNPQTGQYDVSITPTFKDFYKQLRAQPEYEAQEIATVLELYVEGTFNTFSHKTNIGSLNHPFVVYDIKDMGNNIKSLALQIILDSAWQAIIKNKEEGLTTYLYIDEAHLLFANNSSVKVLQEIYKRCRKHNGTPTCISQNVTDILMNPYANTIFSNCEFIEMLNQSPADREILAQMFNISDRQLNYISNTGVGEGLIRTSSCMIPFQNRIPSDTLLYKLITTKPQETYKLYGKGRKEEE